MNSYMDRLFDILFDNEKEYRCDVDGTWPCADSPYGIDVFVFELIRELEVALHKDNVLEDIYLDCCERLGIDLDVFEDDPVEFFLAFMRHNGHKVFKFKEYEDG